MLRDLLQYFGKKTCSPSITFWARQMLFTLPLEKITYIQKGRQGLFEKICRSFTVFMKSLDLTEDVESE